MTPRSLRTRRHGLRFAPIALATGLLAVAGALPLAAEAVVELRPVPPPGAVDAVPPLPPPDVYPVQLVLDDDSADGSLGVTSGQASRQFVWFTRFTAPTTMHLEEIWVLFPQDPNVPLGGSVELAVFEDTDGDPTNGATLRDDFLATVQAADGQTFSIYPLATSIDFAPGRDVILAVAPRFLTSGVTPPTFPAAIDTASDAGRSWIALWNADPPSPLALPGDLLTQTTAAAGTPGNWMIRGFGTGATVTEIPTLGVGALALLAAALGAASVLLLRRRSS